MLLLPGNDPAAVQAAARRLADGELLGLPTETVYGLAARADSDAAVAKIFAAKGRPSDHPLIVHVLDAAGAEPFADHLPATARRLMEAFWPGPLTVIVPRQPGMAEAAAGGQATVALRAPAHPVARAVLAAARELGVPGVAAPSANRFGRVSPTLARHVVEEFGPGLMVLDGGACEVGIESSIVDCSRARPALLRPGLISPARIEAALGEALAAPDAHAPKASGTLAAHYAPTARVRLLDAERLALRFATAAASGGLEGVAVYSRAQPPAGLAWKWQALPADPAVAAHELFAVLRALDAAGAREIWVEAPPCDPTWDGVRDRLSRAAAAFTD
ncbi:L-threonylcarbamoyladenylate synthase [Roseateles saccharophilus]|uniref:Threonylcarbamoyl-AMP synthase n=1 Tax=Roseateles saccharophilus TaxID=304 RepID=A0A4R3U9S9_ROSSA|nr:L-threonylcarbamoyladenylate synthase [Roseateles saccharophilus]MDG0835627.1 threonylcarbamoyl-AMP synthase [Roseateles saccharophilus]TCU85134.1 translation factor SUA5 [Roseateles saccharophilus]